MTKKGGKKPISRPKKIGDIKKRKEEHIRKVLSDVERARKKSTKKGKGWSFTGVDEDVLRKKLQKSKSPMIVYQSFNHPSPGGKVSYTIGINNPDPDTHERLWVHVFVGPANMCTDVCSALALVDPRFPRLSLPKMPGLSVSPGTTENLTFSIDVPSNIEHSIYLGNAFLFRTDWHDFGIFYDCSCFPFEVK